MPDIKSLNILTISCNTIATEREDKGTNCSTNTHSTHDVGSEQCCANTGPERSCTIINSNMYCYTKTGNTSNLKNSNAFTSMVKNNDIKYFLPGPSLEIDKEQALK